MADAPPIIRPGLPAGGAGEAGWRILHLADLHLRDALLEVQIGACAAVVAAARAELAGRAGLTVVAGDLLDAGRLSPAVAAAATALLTGLAAVGPVAVLPGPHDAGPEGEDAGVLAILARGARGPYPVAVLGGAPVAFQPPGGGAPLVLCPLPPGDGERGARRALAAGRKLATGSGPGGGPGGGPEGGPGSGPGSGPGGGPVVAVWHGDVGGAELPGGERYPPCRGGALTAAALGRFDAALGGGVHLAQRLDGSGEAWYAGSLVQLSFRERPAGHGAVLWDLRPPGGARTGGGEGARPPAQAAAGVRADGPRETETPGGWRAAARLVPVEPGGGFHALRLPAAAPADWAAWAPRLDRPAAVRLAAPPGADRAGAAAARDAVAAVYAARWAADPGRRPAPAVSLEPGGDAPAVADLLAPARQCALVRELAAAAHPGDTRWAALADRAAARHAEALRAGPGSGGGRGRRWVPVALRVTDMFCFRSAVVDFAALGGALAGILAPNGSGKTSLIEALVFAAYGELVRCDPAAAVRRGAGDAGGAGCAGGAGVAGGAAGRFRTELIARCAAGVACVEREGGRGRARCRVTVNGVEPPGDPEAAARALLGEAAPALATCLALPASGVDLLTTPEAERLRQAAGLLGLGGLDGLHRAAAAEQRDAAAEVRAVDAQLAALAAQGGDDTARLADEVARGRAALAALAAHLAGARAAADRAAARRAELAAEAGPALGVLATEETAAPTGGLAPTGSGPPVEGRPGSGPGGGRLALLEGIGRAAALMAEAGRPGDAPRPAAELDRLLAGAEAGLPAGLSVGLPDASRPAPGAPDDDWRRALRVAMAAAPVALRGLDGPAIAAALAEAERDAAAADAAARAALAAAPAVPAGDGGTRGAAERERARAAELAAAGAALRRTGARPGAAAEQHEEDGKIGDHAAGALAGAIRALAARWCGQPGQGAAVDAAADCEADAADPGRGAREAIEALAVARAGELAAAALDRAAAAIAPLVAAGAAPDPLCPACLHGAERASEAARLALGRAADAARHAAAPAAAAQRAERAARGAELAAARAAAAQAVAVGNAARDSAARTAAELRLAGDRAAARAADAARRAAALGAAADAEDAARAAADRLGALRAAAAGRAAAEVAALRAERAAARTLAELAGEAGDRTGRARAALAALRAAGGPGWDGALRAARGAAAAAREYAEHSARAARDEGAAAALAGAVAAAEARRAQRAALEARRAELEDTRDAAAAYARATDPRDGLAAVVLERAAGAITALVNGVLGDLADFYARVDGRLRAFVRPDPPGAPGSRDEDEVPADAASGYERFVLSLALRLALAAVATCTLPDAIVVDEGFGALDPARCARAAAFMRDALPRRAAVCLVVTHVAAVAGAIERPLRIARRAGGSIVEGPGATGPGGARAGGVEGGEGSATPPPVRALGSARTPAAAWGGGERPGGAPVDPSWCPACRRRFARIAAHLRSKAHAKAARLATLAASGAPAAATGGVPAAAPGNVRAS